VGPWVGFELALSRVQNPALGKDTLFAKSHTLGKGNFIQN
jgi:hypothetical protein